MAMRKFKEIKVSTGEYTNQQGEVKKRYSTVGILFQDDENGRMSILLETIPMGKVGEDGIVKCWLSCFDPYDPNKQQQGQQYSSQGYAQQPAQQQMPQRPQMPQQGYAPADAPPQIPQPNADDIPF